MTTNTTAQVIEVRFTAKRASQWNNGLRRWMPISRDEATVLVAMGLAVDITDDCI